MENYTRLGEPLSPRAFSTDGEEMPSSGWWRGMWSRLFAGSRRQVVEEPVSGIMTIIPLNDKRLRPARTRLLVLVMILLGVAASAAVFILVPRGVAGGHMGVHEHYIDWSHELHAFQLHLNLSVPITNNNYFKAKLDGTLELKFFDASLAKLHLGPRTIQPLESPSRPERFSLDIGLGGLPEEYEAIWNQMCGGFPWQLIFFLQGSFKASCLGQTQAIPQDTYFTINCKTAHGDPPPPSPPAHHPPPQAP